MAESNFLGSKLKPGLFHFSDAKSYPLPKFQWKPGITVTFAVDLDYDGDESARRGKLLWCNPRGTSPTGNVIGTNLQYCVGATQCKCYQCNALQVLYSRPPSLLVGKDKSGDKLLQRQDWFRCTKHRNTTKGGGSDLTMKVIQVELKVKCSDCFLSPPTSPWTCGLEDLDTLEKRK